MTPNIDDRVKLIEDRRKAAESVLWQLPGFSLAAQAFLLGVGLAPDAKASSQVVVGLLGGLAVFATGLVVLFQALRATTLGHWVEWALNEPLGPNALAEQNIKLNRCQKWLLGFGNVYYVMWAAAGLAFLAADVYVVVRGLTRS